MSAKQQSPPGSVSASFLGREFRGGRYVIQEKISQGGSAWLFKALHQTLKEPMAIKLLYPQFLENEVIRKRFLEEARIQFRLRHQNIVHVTDVIDEEFHLGMVMEWVEGQDFRVFLQNKTEILSFDELKELMCPIIGAVDHVHRQGLVHRDIKPANILLARHQGVWQPKLTDFGIAKVLYEEGATATGSTLGTVTYMAPEQIDDAKQATPRSDIYSLGVLLYQAVTGKVPFGGTAQNQLMGHLSKEPKPPIQHNPKIPKALNRVILWCLKKEAYERPENCEVLLGELLSALGTRRFVTSLQLPVVPLLNEEPPKSPKKEADRTVLELTPVLMEEPEDAPTLSEQRDSPPMASPAHRAAVATPAPHRAAVATPAPASRPPQAQPSSRKPAETAAGSQPPTGPAKDAQEASPPGFEAEPSFVKVLPTDMGIDDAPASPSSEYRVPTPKYSDSQEAFAPKATGSLSMASTGSISMGATGAHSLRSTGAPSLSSTGRLPRPPTKPEPPTSGKKPLLWGALFALLALAGWGWHLKKRQDAAVALKKKRALRDFHEQTRIAPRPRPADAPKARGPQVCFELRPKDTFFFVRVGGAKYTERDDFCLPIKGARARVIIWRRHYHGCEFRLPTTPTTLELRLLPKHEQISGLRYCVRRRRPALRR